MPALLLFNVRNVGMVLCLLTFQNSIQKVYADDITLEFQYNTAETQKRHSLMTLLQVRDYFRTWKLNPNPLKTDVVCFNLNNILTSYKLDIVFTVFNLNT